MNAPTKYRLSVAALLAVGLVVAFGPSAAQAQSSDQVALISLSSYDEIIEDVGFIGKLTGKPEVVQQMEGMLMFMTQGKGLAGLDKSKPIGIVAYAQGEELSAIAMIPITDKDALVDLIEGFTQPVQMRVAITETGNDHRTFEYDNARTVGRQRPCAVVIPHVDDAVAGDRHRRWRWIRLGVLECDDLPTE